MQALPITAAAAYDGLLNFGGTTQAPGLSSGIGRWDGDAAYDQLKKDLLKSINEDLLMKVEDLEMKGEVGVILTFSDNALINAYSKANTNKTYEVGGKETYTYEEMAQLCFDAAEKPLKIKWAPIWLFGILANLPKIKKAGKHDIILFSKWTLSHDLVGDTEVGEASFAEYLKEYFGKEN